MLKKRLFGAEGTENEAEGTENEAENEAEGAGDEGLAAVISTPEAPILTPPPKRGNWGNQTEKPAENPAGNEMEIEMGNPTENQGNE